MLHILLMILKIIGIIIAVILGLVLLVVLVLIFAPLHYKMDAKCDGTLDSLDVDVRFSWLYHLISGFMVYRENSTVWNLRIAWKQVNQREDMPEEKKEKEEDMPTQKSSTEKEEEEQPDAVRTTETQEINSKRVIDPKKEDTSKSKAETKKKEKKKKRVSLSERIKNLSHKIKFTILKICDKIKMIGEKKEKIMTFIEDEIHRNAFTKLRTEFLRLIRFLKPKCIKGRIHFGLEDPYDTGRVLAGLSVVYPFYGKNLVIEPDFEAKVLEGELHIKGKIRGMHAIIVCFNLLINQEIRTTYKHIREFKL